MRYEITTKYTAEYLRELCPTSLESLLFNAQEKQFELQEQCIYTGRRKTPTNIKQHYFKKVKKDIARIKTITAEQVAK